MNMVSQMNMVVKMTVLALAFGVVFFATPARATDNNSTNTTNVTTTTTTAPVTPCVNVTEAVTSTNTTTNATTTTNVTTCVACENQVKLSTVTNATDNTTSQVNVTECVPIPVTTTTVAATTTKDPVTTTAGVSADTNTTKISGSLALSFSLPENVTVATLNSDTKFKGALADTIKEALALTKTATVTVTKVASASSTTTNKSRKGGLDGKKDHGEKKKGGRLSEKKGEKKHGKKHDKHEHSKGRNLASASLELDVTYEITLPKSEASFVYTKIADKATFQDAVKAKSVAHLTSGGFTGYSVDAVVAANATGDLAPVPEPAPITTTAEATTSGAPASHSAPLSSALLLLGTAFSFKFVSF